MEQLNKKANTYCQSFKTDIKTWLKANNTKLDIDIEGFVRYIDEYPHLVFSKEDLQKKKRIKNSVPSDKQCIAELAIDQQCTRRKRSDSDFCGTHIKGTPHGIMGNCTTTGTHDNLSGNGYVKKTKVDIWVQEIKGIQYYIDADNNVYKPEDIISNKTNPAIIAKCTKTETGVYKIPLFGI